MSDVVPVDSQPVDCVSRPLDIVGGGTQCRIHSGGVLRAHAELAGKTHRPRNAEVDFELVVMFRDRWAIDWSGDPGCSTGYDHAASCVGKSCGFGGCCGVESKVAYSERESLGVRS